MKAMDDKWYRRIWSLDIKNQSWVENTPNEVDFLIEKMELTGKERILDLACGFGRHALEFAKRGYEVVGVDITKDYVEDANREAQRLGLPAHFYNMDIREVTYENEFDVVLNLADGAIGYLENDEENEKILDVVARALKPGGKHLMDIVSADYANVHFPCKLWDAGEQGLTLSEFEWNPKTQIMLYGQRDYAYGEALPKPEMSDGCPTRLYYEQEMVELMKKRGLQVLHTYSDYHGTPASALHIQLMVLSEKPFMR